ncbi:MAG: autotransporter-associated beta strand repeat-containing protein [Planctomycetota bacterium]|nr:autotransporter-associated beta strand repeat-containing protein [Planctomycetota bacterium]
MQLTRLSLGLLIVCQLAFSSNLLGQVFTVNLGDSTTNGSLLSGSAGLTLNGGGTLRLTNNANDYTGTTTINNGSLIITSLSQLGLDPSTVVVTRQNSYPGSGATIGFGGGSLVLDGTGGAINFTRNLSLQARGPIGDRGAALLSVGNNTISGNITAASPFPTTPPTAGAGLNSRINSVMGNLTFAGGLDVAGTAGTTFTILGGNNTAGMNNFTIAGPLTGTGTIEKTGSGTLFLNPSATSGFSGRIRVGGGAAIGQSSVRISSATVGANSVFGTEAAPATPMTFPLPGTIPAGAGSNSTIDMNGGVLEVRANANQTFANNVYARTGSTFFADRAIGGLAVGGTVTFGNLHSVSNVTNTFNSRNGYGMTFGAQTLENVANGNNTFTNGLAGLLTFDGNVWNNNDTTARTLSIGGNGNTRITGGINSSGTGLKTLNKDGTGNLTILGVSTLDGPVNINAGGLTITDFRSLNNTNTSAINIGTGGTAGALIIGGGGTPTAAGLTTSKVITLGSTTGAPSIYANQTGTDGIVINTIGGAATVGAGVKTLNLAGTNTANNIINGVIADNSATNTTSILKHGSGTWALGGANTLTGMTTISNGTLKLQANAIASTVLGAANDVTFTANNSYAGGTLEFVGQAGVNNTQALDQLFTTSGANTIRLTPGAGGTASLSFVGQNTNAAGSINVVGADFINNRFSVGTTANGLANRTYYWNGADYAYTQLGVFRAPVYGTDGGFVTSATALAAGNNEITGDFTVPASISISTLKMNGARTLTIDPASTVTFTGAGVLATGGNSTITGGTVALGTAALVARVNLPTDQLEIASTITGTAGFTKNGAGTLVLSGANTVTGTRTINEGTLRLGSASALGGINSDLNIRSSSAVLDLNGFNTGATTIGQLNNNGTITNTGALANITVGNNNQGGTSFGTITGPVSVTKVGTAGQNWWGISNYTGATTIGASTIAVDSLANIGTGSGIGAGDSTNATTNAASLVFETGGGLDYRGAILDGILTLGARSASTDRLFTINGTTATLSSTVANNNSVAWTNTGEIAFGGTPAARTLTLTGGSQGENTLVPRITDNGGGSTSVTKSGTGIWRLGAANNNYTGATTINQGILMATDGQGLSSGSNLVFNGGTLYSQGTISREIGTAAGQMQFAAPSATTALFSGGFLGGDSKLTVGWTTTPEWGATAQFIAARDGLILNGSHSGSAAGAVGSNALSEVELTGNFSLGTAVGPAVSGLAFTTAANNSGITAIGGAGTAGLVVGQTITGTNIPAGSYIVSINSATSLTLNQNASAASTTGTDLAVAANSLRAIRVDDNGNTGADYARLSGVISGNAGTGIRKLGGGQLLLSNNNNSYSGETNVFQGSLAVNSLGNSTVAGNSSVGTNTGANNNSNAVTLGNGTTGAGILQYFGAGETSDRKIRLNTTTGNTQIHADGTGALILTNVANDMVTGAKVLFLRGTNAAGNTVSSTLADNGGALGVTVDGSANWILSGINTYTGTTNAGAGALGVGSNNALGGSTLQFNNGNLYAYGADRTIGIAGNAPIVQHLNNTSMGFQGDNSILVANALVNQSAANNTTTNNNIVAGKSLTFTGITANLMTANRNWGVDGSGLTIVNGDITTTTAFGLSITKNGDGILQLNGTGGNFNQNGQNIDIDRGTLRMGATNAIPSLAAVVGPPAITTSGGVVLSPELAQSDVATFELAGFSQSINALTNTTDGTAIINNNSASPVTLTVGNNNAAVSFGNGTNNAISNSGGGALSLTKVGTGAATIGGNSTFTGVTTVTSGAVTITNNNSLGSTVANTVINSNGTTTTGGTLSLGVSSTPGVGITTSENFLIQGTGDGGTFATALGGVGGVSHNINGVVTLNSTQSFRLGSSGAGTITNFGLIQRSGVGGGGIVFNAAANAILNVNQAIDNNLGSITVHAGGTTSLNATLNDIGDALVQNLSTLQTTANDALGLDRALTLGQGALVNGATGLNNDVGTFRFNAGSQTIGALNGFANAGTLPNNATATGSRLITSTLAGAKTLTVGNGNGSGGFDGVITDGTGGALALTKVGTGTQSLLGTVANTNTGVTTVNGGILVLGKTDGVNAVAGNLVVGDGAGGLDVVRLDGSNQIADAAIVSFNGSSADAGILRLNGFNETVAGISSAGGAGIVENGGATASVFTTNFASGIQTFTGVIQDGGLGALSLTKEGAGTQIISGANTFSGATVVNGGILLANSPGALGTSTVTVNSPGTLGGTGGVIAGGITLAGGTLAPGASIGTLDVGSVGGVGTLAIEYDLTTQGIDLLNVAGVLDTSALTLNFSSLGLGTLSNPSYVFATYGSLLGTFTGISGTPSGYSVDYAFGGNNIALVTAVPEPGTLALLTVAIVGGGLYRRSRNAKKVATQS